MLLSSNIVAHGRPRAQMVSSRKPASALPSPDQPPDQRAASTRRAEPLVTHTPRPIDRRLPWSDTRFDASVSGPVPARLAT